MPNNQGGIVDDLIVYRWSQEDYTLVVNASNISKDWDWIMEQKNAKGFDCELEDISDDVSLIAVQGPNAIKLLQKLTSIDLDKIKFNENEYYYHAGTKVIKEQIYATGGRVFNFVCLSSNFLEARIKIINLINSLNWDGGFYRKDIGYKVIDE